MSDIEKIVLNGVEYDITGGIKEDISDLQEELENLDTLVGTGVIE